MQRDLQVHLGEKKKKSWNPKQGANLESSKRKAYHLYWNSNNYQLCSHQKQWRSEGNAIPYHIQNAHKNNQPRILFTAKLSFKTEGKVKTLLDDQKLSKFVARRPTLHEILKEVLQAKTS